VLKQIVVVALATVASLVAGPLVATAAPTMPAPITAPVIRDLGNDMRHLPAQVWDAAASRSPAPSSRSAAPVDHPIFVSVVDVVAGNTGGELSTSDLSVEAVTAAVQQISAYWFSETAGAVTFSLAGYETRSLGEEVCDPDDVDQRQSKEAFAGAFDKYSWVGSNKHLLTLTRETIACGKQAFGTVGGRGGQIFDANGIAAATGIPILLHEFGHNIGFGHADVSICTKGGQDGPLSDFGYLSKTCPTRAYGDVLDIMGFTVENSTPHLSAIEKIQFGYFTGSYVDVAAPGTTVINSLNATTGIRALRIIDPLTGFLYVVEYRTAEGLDAASPEFDNALQSVAQPHGHRLDLYDGDPTVGSVRILRELPSTSPSDAGFAGERTYTETTALAVGYSGDNSVAAFRHPRLDVGEVFSSVDRGFTVRVDAASPAAGATISVDFPPHTPTAVTLAATRSATQTYGSRSRVSLKARVTAADGSVASGYVSFYDGATYVGRAGVDSTGTATFRIAADTTARTHNFRARFGPGPFHATSVSNITKVVVRKASAVTRVSLSSSSVRRGASIKAIVRVSVTGVAKPTGQIVLYANGKRIKKVTLHSARKGTVSVVLPRFSAPGVARIYAKYIGTSSISNDNSVKKTLTIRY